MNTQQKDRNPEQQRQLNSAASALSMLFGAQVIPKDEHDKIMKERQQLLDSQKGLKDLNQILLRYACYLPGFKQYHSKWKPLTRTIERRTQKLVDEKLMIDLSTIPAPVAINLKQAYECFSFDLLMPCYVMLLRTFELIVDALYVQISTDSSGKFVPAKEKLKLLKRRKLVSGIGAFQLSAFLEGRNEVIHEIYNPTEREIFIAFEAIIRMLDNLNISPNQKNK